MGIERAKLLRAFGFPRAETSLETFQQRYPGETFVGDSGFCVLWGPSLVEETGITVERDRGRYELPDLIKQVTIEMPPRHLYERDKAGLVGLTAAPDGGSFALRLQRASYSDYLKTNHQVLLRTSVEWNGASVVLADYLGSGGDRLRTLDTARCSNHLGLNALLIDSDEHAVLIARSKRYDHAYLPGIALGVSVAGSMDWTDSDPFAGVKREMAEELNLNDDMLQPRAAARRDRTQCGTRRQAGGVLRSAHQDTLARDQRASRRRCGAARDRAPARSGSGDGARLWQARQRDRGNADAGHR